MRAEHVAVETKLLEIWRKVDREPFTSNREAVLLLQCQAGWNLIDCIKSLAALNQGAGVMILCRSLFERAAAVDYLSRSTDQVITDYIDFGKIVMYEVATAMGAAESMLGPFKAEYGTLRKKFGNARSWHEESVASLVDKSGFNKSLLPGETGLYPSFYKQTSAIAHGDSFLMLRFLPQGWTLSLEPDEFHAWAVLGLSIAYSFMACILASVSEGLGLALESDFNALHPVLSAQPNS